MSRSCITYRVFAGPKTHEALAPYGADGLASYRKPQWIPFAPDIARVLITPTLGFTYQVTERVARFFGGTKGNYGIAIILLTILVRALMFPLGRKQARSAQKMQSLQPLLKELQDKYKEDKEKLTKETFALYKRHGVNPVSGCLPALIQLPIFVGLWQALNTSFPLRHATLLVDSRPGGARHVVPHSVRDSVRHLLPRGSGSTCFRSSSSA